MSSIDDILNDELGKNDLQSAVSMWLDTGYPPLNKAISGSYYGGMPVGRVVEMFGPPSCGKTAIATEVMIAAQKAGGVAMFADHENSFDVGLAEDLGLDPTTRWIYKQPTTFEEATNMAVRLGVRLRNLDDKTLRPLKGKAPLEWDKPIVVVFDSLASMVPQSKMFDAKSGNLKSAEDYSMHDSMALAKATSTAMPMLSQVAQKANMLIIFLNQVRTKPGVMYGDPTTTPGGNAPEYYSSVRIALRREMIKDKDKEVLGQVINASIVKNKVARPYKKAAWNFMFREDGTGYFDVDGSLVELLADNGVLKRDGNGYIWTDGKKYMKPALKAKIDAEGLRPTLMKLLEGSTTTEPEAEAETEE